MAIECDRWQWRELFASDHGPPDPSTRLVLFVLALHMNSDGQSCFPAQQLIAKRSGLSERSVRTHLAHAEKAGWLRIGRKAQKGQAWFVSDYVATIPDEVVQFCTDKPWEADPAWERAAKSAGRPKGKAPVSGGKPSNSGGRPANGAERAAILAQRPAIDDTTPGKICRDARQGLPTNSSSNSPINSPMNTPCERAVASDRTTRGETVLKTGVRKSEKKPDTEGAEIRANRARAMLKAFPDYTVAEIAKVARVTPEEVELARRPP